MKLYKKYLRFLLPTLPIIIGMLALVGWTLNVSSLRQGIASGVAMNPATALGFILLGLEAIRLHAKNNDPLVSRGCHLAILVVIIASAMKLSDLVLGTSFGIDQLLFSLQLDKYLVHPNRMAPNTALCFFLLGWAMLSMRSQSKAAIPTAQALTMIPALFIPLAIVGYIYGAESFYGIGSYIPMALNTAIAFLFLILTILFTYPHQGFMRVFTSGDSAGKIASILLPATFIVPFLVGWIALAALHAKLVDPELDQALSVVVDVAIFFALSYISIRTLFFSDLHRQKADAELRENESKLCEQKEKLAASYRKLQQLALHLDNVREEEQGRIAREIHDEMGSTLTALKMRIHWLAFKLPPEMAQFTAETEHIDKLVDDTIHTMRHVVSQLVPTQLHDLGFAAAIERYVQDFQNNTGIECGLVLPEEGLMLDDNQSSAIFRILQESLNNVAKHAQATKVRILFIDRNHSLIMLVKDNGVGFDRNAHKDNSFGLLGIRERTLMVNGKARISSKQGRGTQVVISIPLVDVVGAGEAKI